MSASSDGKASEFRPSQASASGSRANASFVFVSGRADGAKSMTIPPSTLALADAAVGDRVLIVLINCGASNGRLAQEGLSLGQEVTILSHTSSGSVIVQAPRQNIGLSAALAQNIYVDLSRE